MAAGLDMAPYRLLPSKTGSDQVRRLRRRDSLPGRLIDTIIDEVRAAVADWARFAKAAGVSKASRAEIAAAQQDLAAHFSASIRSGYPSPY